jgi:hypothetical protein
MISIAPDLYFSARGLQTLKSQAVDALVIIKKVIEMQVTNDLALNNFL